MQNIPPELNFQIWKDLPTESILNLCETNSEFKQICDSEYTWRYLLKRDFKLDYQGYDPKLKYIVVYGQNKIIQKVNQKRLFAIVDEDRYMLYSILGNNVEELYSKIAEDYGKGILSNSVLGEIIDNYIIYRGLGNFGPKDMHDLYLSDDSVGLLDIEFNHIII